MIAFENFPEPILAAVDYSAYYFLLFLPYALLLCLILVPIPVAVVFESFRVNFTYISFQIISYIII